VLRAQRCVAAVNFDARSERTERKVVEASGRCRIRSRRSIAKVCRGRHSIELVDCGSVDAKGGRCRSTRARCRGRHRIERAERKRADAMGMRATE
jgi:hypothetical protein